MCGLFFYENLINIINLLALILRRFAVIVYENILFFRKVYQNIGILYRYYVLFFII